MLRKKGVSYTNKVFYKFGFLLLKDKLAILHIHPKEKVCPPPKKEKNIHPRAKEYPPKGERISTQRRKNIHPRAKEYPPKGERLSTQGRRNIHPKAKGYPPKFKKIKIAFFSKPQLNTGKSGNELNAKNPIYILLIYIFNSNLDDDDREYNNHHLSSSSFWFFFLQSEF
ncbi:hypothetical protein [Ruminococcus intestinalis]|uniref:hypothetical protein n=1 Tax=Ruminococcus intestinalis TaxID=2763066 RepID=UPI003F809FC4